MAVLTMKNSLLTVEIKTEGAQIKSVKDNSGTEYIWHADPKFWGKSAPVLFPICSNLKDGKYIYEGKEYRMPDHGFSQKMDYSVREAEDDKVRLYITDTDETRKMYPFNFDFEVAFTLEGNSLKAEYIVTNKGTGDMYYSVGCHEAYACPEGVEEYAVEFPEEINPDTYLLDGKFLSGETLRIADRGKVLDIKEEYFDRDSVVLKNMGVYSASLVNKKSGQKVRIEFPDFDYFVIWHEPGSGFLCLEPWKGFPDYTYHDYDFTKKDGIIKVKEGEKSISEHTMYFG